MVKNKPKASSVLKKNPLIKFFLLTTSVIVGFPTFLYIISPYYFFAIWNLIDQHRFFWYPLFALVLSFTLTIYASNLKSQQEYRSYSLKESDNSKLPQKIFIFGSILIILSSLFAIINILTASYLTDKAYAINTTYSSTGVTVGSRIPWQVADHRASNVLAADNIAGYLVTNTSKGQTALTTARGGWFNNQPYSSVVSLDGSRCFFDRKKAHARIGGWWSANLTKVLVRKLGNIQVNEEDIWAYCDKETPKVIIPYTKTTHPTLLTTVKVPAGLAVYNGLTGVLEFLSSASSLPGPAYPISLAARQREALSVLNNTLTIPKPQPLWPYLLGRYGWQDTSSDESDPNATNPHELTFAVDSQTYYITPLTARGRSTAIVARADLNASSFKVGSLTPIRVVRFTKPFQSGSITVSEIKKTFPNIGWDTGMKVYEVYPASTTSLRASIGQENDISYQILVTLDSDSWKYCLTGNNGKKSRCALPSDPVRALDPFTQSAQENSISSIDGIKLEDLSNPDLAQLIAQAAQILADRKSS